MLDYHVVVIDPREEYAAGWDLAAVPLDRGMPDDVVRELELDGHSALVALTHDPKLDDLALMEGAQVGGVLRRRDRLEEEQRRAPRAAQGVRRLRRRDRAPARPGRAVHRLQDPARDRGRDPRRDDRGAPRREASRAGRRSPSAASTPPPAKSSRLEHRRPAPRGRLGDPLRLRQAAPRAAARRADRGAVRATFEVGDSQRVVAVVRPDSDRAHCEPESGRLRGRRVRKRGRRHGREPRLRGARRRRSGRLPHRARRHAVRAAHDDRRGARRARRRRAARRAVFPRPPRAPGRPFKRIF